MTTTPSIQDFPSLLPVQINQPTTGTQWGIGQTVQIQWSATIPENGSGANNNVDRGSFTIQLNRPDGSSLVVASGTAEQFMVSEGDIYSKFKTSYTVPSNSSLGNYSIVVEQTVGSAHSSGEEPVIISTSPTSPIDHSKG
jgi:hypothetical protein